MGVSAESKQPIHGDPTLSQTNVISVAPVKVKTSKSQQYTFSVADVQISQSPLKEVSYQEAIEKKVGVVESYPIINKEKLLVPSGTIHPFIDTLYHAFNDHRPISISPDMIWLLIAQGFSQHVNENSKTLWRRIVSWTVGEKKELIVYRNDFVKGRVNNPWEEVFPEFTKQIRKYSGEKMYNLILPNFSTTGQVEKAAFEVTLMDVMKSYFSYIFYTVCGIPSITIEGTREDWQMIIDKTKQLRDYGLDDWVDELLPVLEKFVEVLEGKVDKPFWNGIFKYVNPDESGAVPYINGWVLKFFPYLSIEGKVRENKFMSQNLNDIESPSCEREQRRWRYKRNNGPELEQIPNGISKTDFIWNYLGTEFDMQFLAGFIGISQDKETKTLRPEIGWAIRTGESAKKHEEKEEARGKAPY
jgi:hypothetical protein